MFFFIAAARRVLARDQGRPPDSDLGFWRLLVLEFPILTRRVGAVKVGVIIVAFFGAVIVAEILLNEATPGPFLTPRWRLAVAFCATVVFVGVWTVVHAIRSARSSRRAASGRSDTSAP
jgi:hypothetical protein